MSTDDIDFENQSGEVMETTDDIMNDDDQTSTSQQALKQLNQLTGNNSPVNKVTSTTAVATSSTVSTTKLQKIEPKLGNTKFVYIKNQNGTQTSVQIANSNNSNASNKPVQKLQLVQLPNSASASRIVLKGSPKIILAPGVKTATNSLGNVVSSTGNTRTITVSQAQQLGLISSNVNKSNLIASTSASTAGKTITLPSASGTNPINIKNPPTILNKGVKPIQSLKIAGSNQQIRAVNASGIKYVRVVNVPSTNSNNVSNAKIVNGRPQQVIMQRKIAPQQSSNQIAAGIKSQFVTKKLGLLHITYLYYYC